MMNRPALKKLTIENLRGSVTSFSIAFDKDKKLTIIFGENGSGKSTICDSLDLLGNGRIGSIEDRGLGGGIQKYWPSIGKRLIDISVIIESCDGSLCRASLAKSDVIVQPSTNRPNVVILRRNQILSLIEAKPSERYEAIRRFIDVSSVENSENSLRQLIRDYNSSRDTAATRISENRETISQHWTSAGKPGTNYLAWAESESKQNPNTWDAEIAALTKVGMAFALLGNYPAQYTKAKETIATAKKKAELSQQKAQESLLKLSADADEVMGIMNAAKAFMIKHPSPDVCPLCGSAEKIHDLNQRIETKLSSFSSLTDSKTQVKICADAVTRAEQQLEILLAQAKKHTDEYNSSCAAFTWSPDVIMPAEIAPIDLSMLEKWLGNNALAPEKWKLAETKRQDKKLFISTLRGALKTYNDNLASENRIKTLLPRLNQTLKVIEDERRKFTDAILSGISMEVGRLYEIIHPGEGLNKISLELDAKKRASLEMGATFCGQSSTPPQAYFSDSHLDTLGLCVFMALAESDEPDNTILVIDDVLASVDEPHVDRLVEMLYDETLKFRHCIITTHYIPWREKFRWGMLKSVESQFIELDSWNPSSGISISKNTPRIDVLKGLLSNSKPDSQLVSSCAGVILESILSFLVRTYECALPVRRTKPTLGDLLSAINKKLRASLCLEDYDASVTPAAKITEHNLGTSLDNLEKIAGVRNVIGCHFNDVAFCLPPTDAIEFGKQVLLLAETIIDPECGWPISDKSGSYWSNKSKTKRLLPLKQPS
jgi:energy-coupling factor transporter ATP-binding protein EcfA2